MIVNPQVFNYRFTIGTLVVAFTVLAAYSYTSYVSAQSKEDFLNHDVICIENQPALKNPTMKTIQMLLYSYFLINGYTRDDSKIGNIEMINARNKLKAYNGPKIPCDIKENYKRNKY